MMDGDQGEEEDGRNWKKYFQEDNTFSKSGKNIEDSVQYFKNSERIAKEKTKLQQYHHHQVTNNDKRRGGRRKNIDDDALKKSNNNNNNGPDLFPDELPLIRRSPQKPIQEKKNEKLSLLDVEDLASKRKIALELFSSSLTKLSTAKNNNSKPVANDTDLNPSTSLPGAYAVRGIDADRIQSYDSFITYNNNNESSSSHNLSDNDNTKPEGEQSNLSKYNDEDDVVIADIIDDDEERKKIIGDFIQGTEQAYIVKKKPIFTKRKVLIGIIGIFVITTIAVVVEVLTRESYDEKLFNILRPVISEEDDVATLLQDENYPQGRAFRWLLDSRNLLNRMSYDDEAIIRERYIVALLYFSTGGNYWTDDYGFLNNEESVCDWRNEQNQTKITCTEQQRILSIELIKNNLTGTLPSELSALSYLEVLNLHQNKLTGKIPSSFGSNNNLSLLKELRLSSNLIHGSIPSKVVKLNNLIILRIDNNALTGTIPNDITQSQSLDVIDLSNNQLSGTIPSNFNTILRLQGIFLQSNELTGTIPEKLSKLSSTLISLNLESNKLEGKIPTTIGECRRLEDLLLSNNSLSGSLPSTIGRIMDLEFLNVAKNNLTGTLPTELGLLGRLKSIQLSNNELNGTIPSEIGQMKDVMKIDLHRNVLTGKIPSELNALTSLGWLHVYRNNLIGSIDKEFCEFGSSLRADCAAPNPEIDIGDCHCCFCYNDADPTLEGINYHPPRESMCDNSAQVTIVDNLIKSDNNNNRGKVTCGCADTRGLHVRCHESCVSCNYDESFCVENLWFQVYIKDQDDLFFDGVENKVQYISNVKTDSNYDDVDSTKPSIIEWGTSGWLQGKANKCWVKIDGHECKSCVVQECINKKNAPIITCGQYGNYNGCNESDETSKNLGIFYAIFMASHRDIVNTKDYCPILDPMNPMYNFFG